MCSVDQVSSAQPLNSPPRSKSICILMRPCTQTHPICWPRNSMEEPGRTALVTVRSQRPSGSGTARQQPLKDSAASRRTARQREPSGKSPNKFHRIGYKSSNRALICLIGRNLGPLGRRKPSGAILVRLFHLCGARVSIKVRSHPLSSSPPSSHAHQSTSHEQRRARRPPHAELRS